MFADDIDVSIGCSVFPAEITGWTPLLCHTFKVARQLHYTQEGASESGDACRLWVTMGGQLIVLPQKDNELVVDEESHSKINRNK